MTRFNPSLLLSLNNFLFSLLLFFVFFPWLSFSLNTMDSQPWVYFIAILFVLFNIHRVRIPSFLFYYIFFVSIGFSISLLFTENIFSFPVVRAAGNYFGLFLVALSFYIYLANGNKFPIKFLYVSNVIWLSVSFFQLIFPDSLSFLVLSRSSFDRGVASLAPEPGFFAVHLVFFTWIILQFFNYKRLPNKFIILVVFNIASIVFFAKSALGIIYLFLLLLFYLIAVRHYKLLIQAFLLLLVIFVYIYFSPVSFRDVRFFNLFETLYANGLQYIFYNDGSMNGRLQDIVIPLYYFFHSYGFPAGFDQFGNFEAIASLYLWDGFFWYQPGGNTIMSYIGSFVVELGVFGFMALFSLFSIFLFDKLGRFESIFLFIFLLGSVPIANHMLVFLIMGAFVRKVNNYGDCK
jgi:hypothetical protein